MPRLYITSVSDVRISPDFIVTGIYGTAKQKPYSVAITADMKTQIEALEPYKKMAAAGLLKTGTADDEDASVFKTMKDDPVRKWEGPGDSRFL